MIELSDDGRCVRTGIIVDRAKYSRAVRAGYSEERRAREREKRREYYRAHREHLRVKQREWAERNRARVNAKVREYVKARVKSDPCFRAAHYLQIKLSKGVRNIANGYYPEQRKPFIGCTWREFKSHIENQFVGGMSWENYGKVWEIDHVVPRSEFDLEVQLEQLKCFHYSNLRPLLRRYRESVAGDESI